MQGHGDDKNAARVESGGRWLCLGKRTGQGHCWATGGMFCWDAKGAEPFGERDRAQVLLLEIESTPALLGHRDWAKVLLWSKGVGAGTAGVQAGNGHCLGKETDRNPGVKGLGVGTAGYGVGMGTARVKGARAKGWARALLVQNG